jgi:hypothetical protein
VLVRKCGKNKNIGGIIIALDYGCVCHRDGIKETGIRIIVGLGYWNYSNIVGAVMDIDQWFEWATTRAANTFAGPLHMPLLPLLGSG